MSHPPKVSVVMPAFKASYLKGAIGSILAQSMPDLELIVVDDASPEDLGAVVAEFDDSRLSYSRNPENIGSSNLVANWNLCLEKATGEFFVLASDDDIYHPRFLEELLRLESIHPESAVFHCRVSIIDRDGLEIDRTMACPEWESWEEFLWHRFKRARNHTMPEFMFRTAVLRNSGGFVEFPFAWSSDTATCAKAAAQGGIAYSNEILFQWRSSGQNISTSDRFAKDKFNGFCQFIGWAEKELASSRSPYARLAIAEIPVYRQLGLPWYLESLPMPLLARVLLDGSFGQQPIGRLRTFFTICKCLGGRIGSTIAKASKHPGSAR